MFETFSLSGLTTYTFFIIFAVINLGAIFFALLMTRQISLMNRVFTTPLSSLFSLIGFVAFCVAIGLFVMSLFYLIP